MTNHNHIGISREHITTLRANNRNANPKWEPKEAKVCQKDTKSIPAPTQEHPEEAKSAKVDSKGSLGWVCFHVVINMWSCHGGI